MKNLLTILFLAGTLFSCAAAKPPESLEAELLSSPVEKPSPTKDFGKETPQTIEDLSATPDPEGITITVVPPPKGTALELIDNPPLEEEVAAATYPYMVMRRSGKTNNYNNPIYEVVLFANGRALAKVNAVTGRAHTQGLNRNIAGNESPLPNGRYSVSSTWIGGSHPEVGGKFLPITPLFQTNRSALGFHVDPSYNKNKKEDGTAGCIGLTTVTERDLLFQYAAQYKPRYLQVQI